MASLPISRGSTCSTSDSEDSDADSAMLASCSLQEIRQEDLAAILPDQQECDAFGGFECRTDKNSPQTGDASGSDMELPQQAVNALIQRTTESSSESESHAPLNPNTLCANSLLQQFVAQTQMLNAPCASLPAQNSENNSTTHNSAESTSTSTTARDVVKRKRGRPRKIHKTKQPDIKSQKNSIKSILNVEYGGDPNVSPDSGIQNSPDHVSSPEPSPSPNAKAKFNRDENKPNNEIKKVDQKETKNKINTSNLTNKLKEQNKLPVTSNRFDRVLYGNTDRVLYPPRRKVGRPPICRKGPGRPPKHNKPVQSVPLEPKTENIKPTETIKSNKNEKTEVKSKSKKIKSPRDKEVLQITTNTHNLNINKEAKVGNNKEAKKSKSTLLYEICERVSKRLELGSKDSQRSDRNEKSQKPKHKTRIALSTKTKLDRAKAKYTTLKNAKLMHSKHKHKKHKKYKFKILKPITATNPDPKINSEIEKLIMDFIKFCNISTNKISKENVPEMLKVLKKVSKKRKTSDVGERKKKKQHPVASIDKETNNEQRLPLKKRHYHLSNSESKQDIEVVPQVEAESDKKIISNKTTAEKPKCIPVNQNKIDTTKVTSPSNKNIPVIKSTSPKISGINNNDYEFDGNPESIGTHIDEAIEACINRYASPVTNKTPEVNNLEKKQDNTNTSTGSITTTPKKRHRLELSNKIVEVEVSNGNKITPVDAAGVEQNHQTPLENVVSELKMKRNLTSKFSEQKKPETATAHIITRKKNRLEDLTLNLVSKIASITVPEIHEPQQNKRKKASVAVPDEVVNRASVIKYPPSKKPKAEQENTLPPEEKKPTGIFTPTVDLELQPSNDQKEIKPTKDELKKELTDPNEVKTTSAEITFAPTNVSVDNVSKKRVRKRRAINRTGFPTVKKKKKKAIIPEMQPEITKEECDRVPKLGEEYSTFVERTEKSALSSIIPDQSTVLSSSEMSAFENATKWEDMSECDSLPLEERTDFESQDSLDIKPDIKINDESHRRFKAEASDSNQDLDDLSLDARIAKLKKKKKIPMKGAVTRSMRIDDKNVIRRRLRDVSPASSIEPLIDKRLKEEPSASGDEIKRNNKKPPRWRKKYLVAGLFSDYYKEDDETSRQKRQEVVTAKSRFIYNPDEHPYGLLPPPYHCGKYLRCRKLPFQIPYDLWWQHTHSQLPGRDIVPSWNYRKIRTNVYNIKTTTGACEPQACNCSPTSSCGDDCINRLVLAECPASHKCHNQKIQKHEWAPGLEKFMTEFKGWGVRTNMPIKQSEFILEYVGEVVSDQEFKERMATRYVHDTHHYCLHLDGGLVIDGHRMGGDGRFVNHSCQPNCEMQKWSVNGQFRMALFALRNIQSGEELTYDYNFSLFNAAEGQQCMCGSENCRGVIGGKSQRIRPQIITASAPTGRVGRPRKNLAKRTCSGPKEPLAPAVPIPVASVPQIKPMSHAQKLYVLEHHCFLLRNLKKVKKIRERSVSISIPRTQTATPTNQSAFLNHLIALRKPRNMKTRRLAQAEDDPELNKTAKLASFLRDLCNTVMGAKDEKNELLSSSFVVLPSKRKVPHYYQRISDPIDLTTIEQNIATGIYRTAESFDADMNRLFGNAIKFYGRTSEPGIAATRLKKTYVDAKHQCLSKFEDALGEKPPATFISNKKKADEEDVIRCICGMYRDEGLMIQCERCLVWQHCECVRADESAPSYHCERCVPRKVDFEIATDEYTEHGHRYYMTLLRGELQLRQGDTVYVLRDIPIAGTNRKHTYDTIGNIRYSDLDIFRIERLWKDSKTGQRFAYGHHYLRPHETYHEPTRKFFPNEVMRVPLYEAVPVELVISHCWVLDLNTYCKGRPMGAPEEHIYICEYRVDKTARLFSKVSKSKFPICTKSYAFERFDVRLKMTRTYTPHDLNPAHVKPRGRKPQESDEVRELPPLPVEVPVRTPVERKARLNKILLNLLNKLPTKQVLDVSYLLEGGRRRKKQT